MARPRITSRLLGPLLAYRAGQVETPSSIPATITYIPGTDGLLQNASRKLMLGSLGLPATCLPREAGMFRKSGSLSWSRHRTPIQI